MIIERNDTAVWALNVKHLQKQRGVKKMTNNYRMKTLIFFVLFAVVLTANVDLAFSQEVCPFSKGYWKTHPDAEAWVLCGGDVPICAGCPTPYEVMSMIPKKGNALVILLQQYIAYELNSLSGSCVPSDPAALNDAIAGTAALIFKYMPLLDIPKNDPDRALALQYGKTFDDYNNGYMCPDLCVCPCWTAGDLASLTASSCVQSSDDNFISVATYQNYTLTTSATDIPECNVVDHNNNIGFALAINYTQFLDCRDGLEMLIDNAGLICSEP